MVWNKAVGYMLLYLESTSKTSSCESTLTLAYLSTM